MELSSFIQLASAYTGLLAALFFAFGVVTQNIDMMLDMSQAYYGPNPSTIKSLSQQKADYTLGIIGLLTTFTLQAVSFLAPKDFVVLIHATGATMLFATIFLVIFFCLRWISKKMAEDYESQIRERLKKPELELPDAAS